MVIDVKEHTPMYKLFHYPFYFKVPEVFTISDTELEVRGVPTTGDALQDQMVAMEPITVQATIRQMIEYRRDGAEITLVNPEDSGKIYEIIAAALGDISAQLDRSLNVQLQDQELIRDLDDFAGELYKIARHYIAMAPTDNTKGLGVFERGRGLGLKPKSKVKLTLEKEHKPMSESISIKALERNKRWQ